MSKKSISQDVKAANSKLAIYLRRKEEEEASLGIGKRKPKKLQEESQRLPGGRARWAMDPDFRVPTPMVDRPRTESGATSFHFSYIPISKQAVPVHNGEPVEGPFGKGKDAALLHSKYIERDGAAETSRGAEHAAYLERPDVIETIDPSALIAEAVERNVATIINETPTAEEAAIMGDEQEPIEGIPSVFSNISDDPFERQEYWRAVERCEREPRVHEIILEPDLSPAWWQELETTTVLDPAFKNHALMVAEAYRQWLDTPTPLDERKAPFKAAPFLVSAERAGAIIMQAQQMRSYDFSRPPFEFKSGRGGRVQYRFVAELPHEVTPEDRALIVQNFCDHIGGLIERKNPDGSVVRVGMMYTAVIHAPDPHNDRRNYHLHVVAHDRPARFLEDEGVWDFEFAETYLTSRREERVRYPFRQSKIEEISRVNDEGTNNKIAGINFIPTLRRKFADITNTVLTARGIDRRLDPRKYTEMGIDRTPTEHLGTKAAALEAIGVPTIVGQLNAIAIWSDAERSILRQAAQADQAYKTHQQEIDRIARAVTAIDPASPSLKTLRELAVERARLIADVAEDRQSIMTFDHLEAKAKSRAVRTRQTCLQFLADIEAGRADRNTRIMKQVIEARWKDASDHIKKIDNDLKPHRQALADAARDVERREQRIRDIDVALKPVMDALDRQVQARAMSTPGAGKAASQPAPTAPVTPDQVAPSPGQSAAPSQPEPASAASTITPPAATPTRDLEPAARDHETAEPSAPEPTRIEPVKPVAIEGLPIVEPTIAPAPREAEPEVSTDTPEGLTPLRPTPEVETPDVAPVTVVEDITQPAVEAQEQAPTATAGPDQRAADDGVPAPSAGDSAAAAPEPEPKVDRRRKVEDPKLFDTPDQLPPVKPGTTKAEYEDWNALINRIARDRIPVQEIDGKSNAKIYKVPSLSPAEQELLHAKRFHGKTIKRLAALSHQQRQEINKLVRWIRSEHGQNSALLILEGRTAKLGNVRPSVRTMFQNWGRHEDVAAALQTESARRIELAAQLVAERTRPAAKPTPAPDADRGADRAARKAEAERIYPAPDQVYTREVAEFTRLLRELAPERQLQDAADRIYEKADAREDVQRHNPELAVAYARYIEDHDARMIAKARDARGGKGGR